MFYIFMLVIFIDLHSAYFIYLNISNIPLLIYLLPNFHNFLLIDLNNYFFIGLHFLFMTQFFNL